MKTFAEFCSILLVALITVAGAQAIADDDADTPADKPDVNIEPGEDSAPADEVDASTGIDADMPTGEVDPNIDASIETSENSAPTDEDSAPADEVDASIGIDADMPADEDSVPADETDQDSAPVDKIDASTGIDEDMPADEVDPNIDASIETGEDSVPGPAAKPDLLNQTSGPFAIGIEAGHGSSETDSWRVVLQSHWHKRWFDKGRWYLTGYWELDYARWETTRTPNPGGVDNLYTFGGTPVFRLVRKRTLGIDTLTYIEGAVGFHWLSDSFIADKNLSAKFQFGDHVGAGIFFGPDDCYELGYRLQHFSNGGLDSPNPGMDFHSFRLVSHF